MSGMTSAPDFTGRVPIQFIVPDNTALNITGTSVLFNNPKTFFVQPGATGKIEMGINGSTYFRGDGEFSPFVVELDWAQLGYTDYLKLAALRPYFVHLVSFRNIGYYGKLVMSGPKNDVVKASDVVSTKGMFYVLGPSDQGGAQAVARVPTPSILTNANTAGGYLSTATNYYFQTFSTIWGESLPSPVLSVTASANTKNALSWSWPTSAFCTKSTIYCANINDSTQAKLMAEVLNGEAGGPTWTDYVGFPGCVVSQTPPLVSSAYRGTWQQGIFFNETP